MMEYLGYGIPSLFVLSSIGALWYAHKANRLLKQRETELHKLAYYDVLTGMSNRLRFNEESARVLELARINKQRCAIILVDLDDFKSINDTYGHHIGDEFLKKISLRLEDVLNDHPDDDSFASRLGGDEFVLMINDVKDAQHVATLVREIYERFEAPVVINQTEIEVGLSMGISLYPYDGTSISTLLKAADLALYTSKEDGKNTFFFHEKKMSTRFERLYEHQLVARYFIDTEDFQLRYQPLVDISTGSLKGAEVLFGGNKLKYPTLNIQEMIEVAEESEDIITLGDLILRRACTDYVKDISRIASDEFRISVNISVRQLNEDDFVNKVLSILSETEMPPTRLCLEITETALMTNYKDITVKMEALKKFGIVFSIDDFGKEYSSMSHLRKLAVSKLKIDKSFIEDISDKKSNEIVKAIVTITKTLGLECTAEGVETEEQFRFLRSIECDMVQGYLLSPPLLLEAFMLFAVRK